MQTLCRRYWRDLSGPLQLRVQSRSRTRLSIVASIAFLFRACFKGAFDKIALWWHVSPWRFASDSASQQNFAAIPSVSLVLLGHTNRSVKFSHKSQREIPSFRHFQDRFLTTVRKKWGKKTGLCFAGFVFLTFRGPFASDDVNPYLKRSRNARYKASDSIAPLSRG